MMYAQNSVMTSTYVGPLEHGIWPHTPAGYVIHRRDLSDLAEPYLSAVKNARANTYTMPIGDGS